jgi:hypothetical protein
MVLDTMELKTVLSKASHKKLYASAAHITDPGTK